MLEPVELERRVERLGQLAGDVLGVRRRVERREQDPELVAAEPRDGVALRGARPGSRGPTCCSSSSPRSWPSVSLTSLNRSRSRIITADTGPFTARRGDRLRGPILEQQPVRQARQMVIHREPAVLVRAACELLPIPAHPSRASG